MAEWIRVRGAREHNLRDVSVDIPRERLCVITGLSGSGKSSLAFDTIFAEGQRRYVESLSSYARQFLGLMEKPDVDAIDGLSPAIAIDQKSASHNPRSTVATVTEIYDYLRLLYARVGHPHCPSCGAEVSRQTPQQIVDWVLARYEERRLLVLAPLVRERKGSYEELFERLAREGWARVLVDGVLWSLEDRAGIALARYEAHSIAVVVDRLVARRGDRQRLTESVETALGLAGGMVEVVPVEEGGELGAPERFSEALACARCGISLGELEPRSFSFNSPFGACPSCGGLGVRYVVDEDLVLPDPSLSVLQGAVAPLVTLRADVVRRQLERALRAAGFSLAIPVGKLPEAARRLILEGSPEPLEEHWVDRMGRERRATVTFQGVASFLERRRAEADSEFVRQVAESFMREVTCDACGGTRLRAEARSVTVDGVSLDVLVRASIREAAEIVDRLDLAEREVAIATPILREISARLQFLIDVGLDYLTLGRAARTLSGGEAQRIRLASQIGSGLAGVLYVLDEPSIGLHQRDNRRLIETLWRLRDLGNTVLVVEHDEDTIRAADWVVDVGPGAGEHGGEVLYAGPVEGLGGVEGSLTGAYLTGRRRIEVPEQRRSPERGWLRVLGASEHNLADLDVAFPIGLLTCVTGVSGSGKSTLVNEILYKALRHRLHRAHDVPGRHKGIEGVELVDKVIAIDQAPIGRTPRSNPATYTGLFDHVRRLFAETPEARARGYRPGRFSFNVKGGRCEACQGEGTVRIEMNFLADVFVTCDVCKGARYNRDTLEIRFRGLTIADVLALSVEEAQAFFARQPAIVRHLDTLAEVGLGYVRLGQAATTLSGGEAQRVKLATELARRATGRTVYILDEPTTGLHFEDVRSLLGVLHSLVDQGNTVIVIEHNLDVVKTADWIIDLGPEGGVEGGTIVAEGTPEQVAATPGSHTGAFLAPLLRR
jgi:excinuclease ABC subunit A